MVQPGLWLIVDWCIWPESCLDAALLLQDALPDVFTEVGSDRCDCQGQDSDEFEDQLGMHALLESNLSVPVTREQRFIERRLQGLLIISPREVSAHFEHINVKTHAA